MMLKPAMLLSPTLLVLARALNAPNRQRGTAPRELPRTRIVGPVAIRTGSSEGASDPECDGVFRRRYVRPGGGGDADGSAVVFTLAGIEGSHDWHKSDGARKMTGRPHVRERAICINSIAHYEEMGVAVPDRPATGENILVGSEFNVDTLCLGDTIACDDLVSATTDDGGGRPEEEGRRMEFVVTHVRRPCQRWIKMYSEGTFLRVMRRGLAGIFLAVKGDGDEGERSILRVDGAGLRVSERKHPDWPLRRLNSLVYGESGFDKKPMWRGTDEELEELINIEELGMWQWKDYLIETSASKRNP